MRNMLNILNQSVSTLALLTSGARELFVVEADLCIIKCLAAFLASTQYKMSLASPQL